MGGDWAEKLKHKLKEKEIANQEAKKSFQIYQDATLKLFEFIEKKVKEIEMISISRYMVGQSEIAPTSIKALKLKCQEKFLEFIPEGINLDSSKGRVRLKHNSRSMPQFVYLHLIVDANSNAPYPDNLIWVFNEKNADNFPDLPPFHDECLEKLIELAFLE